MRTASNIIAVLAFAALAAGCGKHTNAPRPDLNFITRAQLVENNFQNAYDAVAALRSNWLQVRGPDSFATPSQVLVYYDDVKLGGVDELRSISTTTIEYLRHYDGNEATSRWGVGHSAGVIQVSSRAQPAR